MNEEATVPSPMYVYTKDVVASHIDTGNTKENTYIKGHSGFILTFLHCTFYVC